MAEGEVTTFSALTEKFNLPGGNYKLPKLLYCSNGGHFLRILPDGTVDGTRDRSDLHSKCPAWLHALARLGFLLGQGLEDLYVSAAAGHAHR